MNLGWNDAWHNLSSDGWVRLAKDTPLRRKSFPSPPLSPTIPSGLQPPTSKETNSAGKHTDHSTHGALPLQPYNSQLITLLRALTLKDSSPLTCLRRLHVIVALHSELPPTSLGNAHVFSNHASIMGFIPTCIHSHSRSYIKQQNAHISFLASLQKEQPMLSHHFHS
jgi:hypothetical protein